MNLQLVKYRAIRYLLLVLTLLLIQKFSSAQDNNVRAIIQHGDKYLIHTVVPQETLYRISKTYHVTVSDLEESNPKIKNYQIEIGQEITIPVLSKRSEEIFEELHEEKADSSQSGTDNGEVKASQSIEKKAIIHRVKAGETLYSISRKYDIRVQDIINWNKLDDFNIQSGQDLIVGYGKNINPVFEDVAIPDESSTPEIIQKQEIKEDKKEVEGPKLKVKVDHLADEQSGPGFLETEISLKYKEGASSRFFEEKSQQGIVAWIDENSYPAKMGYFALHKELPVGTMIKVTNTINNHSVYAKVIGTLPDNAANQNILLKLPSRAADELKVSDEKLMVKVSYLMDIDD